MCMEPSHSGSACTLQLSILSGLSGLLYTDGHETAMPKARNISWHSTAYNPQHPVLVPHITCSCLSWCLHSTQHSSSLPFPLPSEPCSGLSWLQLLLAAHSQPCIKLGPVYPDRPEWYILFKRVCICASCLHHSILFNVSSVLYYSSKELGVPNKCSLSEKRRGYGLWSQTERH